MKIDKRWDLPPPPPGPQNTWYPYVKVKGSVPWGYYENADDPQIMMPIPRELDLLEKGKTYLKEYSYKDVAEWLTKESGRYISHLGLRKRIKSERRRRKLSEHARWYEEEAKKAAEKARKLEETLGGSGIRDTVHPSNCSCGGCRRHTKSRRN